MAEGGNENQIFSDNFALSVEIGIQKRLDTRVMRRDQRCMIFSCTIVH